MHLSDTPYDSAGKDRNSAVVYRWPKMKNMTLLKLMSVFETMPCMLACPFNDPEISVTVVLENVGGGSKNAAPVARQIMDFYFRDRVFETAEADSANTDNELGTN